MTSRADFAAFFSRVDSARWRSISAWRDDHSASLACVRVGDSTGGGSGASREETTSSSSPSSSGNSGSSFGSAAAASLSFTGVRLDRVPTELALGVAASIISTSPMGSGSEDGRASSSSIGASFSPASSAAPSTSAASIFLFVAAASASAARSSRLSTSSRGSTDDRLDRPRLALDPAASLVTSGVVDGARRVPRLALEWLWNEDAGPLDAAPPARRPSSTPSMTAVVMSSSVVAPGLVPFDVPASTPSTTPATASARCFRRCRVSNTTDHRPTYIPAAKNSAKKMRSGRCAASATMRSASRREIDR